MLIAPREFIARHLEPLARFVVSILVTVLLGGLAPAQEQEPDPTAEQIQQRRAAIETDTSLDEAVRTAALAELQTALDALSRATEAKATAARYEREAGAAPAAIEQVKAELAKPTAPAEPEVGPQWTAADVEERRDQAQTAAADAVENLTSVEARAQRRSERDTAIGTDREAERAKLTRLLADLESPPEQPHPALTDAVRWRLLAKRVEANAAIDQLAAEDKRNAAERELMPLRVDLARQLLTVARTTLASWEKLLHEQRRREAARADEAAARARGELATRFPPLQQVIDEIERLTAQHSGPDGVVAKRDAVREQQAIIDQMLERTRKSYADATARYLAGGFSVAFGLFLRLEYDKLPNRRQLQIEARKLKSDISDATLQALILRERRKELGELGARVVEFLARVPPSESAAEREQLEQAATELFGDRRDVLGLLSTDYEPYVRELLRLGSATDQLLAVTDSYEDFIREHILWVRSVAKPFAIDTGAFRDSALWLLRGDPERQELSALGRDFARQWSLWALLALIIMVALAARRRGSERIDRAAPLVKRHKTDALSLTAKVLGWTLVAALPFPLLVLGAGQIVEQNVGDSTWRLGWVTALGTLAIVLLSLSVLLQTLRPNGLAHAHFRWSDSSCRALSVAVRRYAIPAVIVGAAQVVIQYASDPAYHESTGRVLGLASIALWGLFAWRIFTPKGPVLAPFYTRNPDSLITRLRRPIFLFGMGIPAGIIVATVVGYFFTARVFAGCLLLTYVLVFGLLMFHGLAMRWLFFHRRRLAVDEAMHRRKEREEQQSAEGVATEPEVDADDDIDIPALNAHTKTLFRAAVAVALIVGLLSIWSPLLPALKALDRVQVWPSVRVLTVVETDAATALQEAVATESADPAPEASDAAGAPSLSGMPPLTPGATTAPAEVAGESSNYSLTLADLLTAIVFAIVTVVVVRHVPALLEIGVLTRLKIDAGARYAIATLVRYLLIGVGVALTFGTLGIGWSSIQWLAAALTFGLAFGLQEIFANFISGLILLVERPIRVGDTVTVGAVQGTVARIRTRATTVLDYDNREHLIPNKSLITDSVINWTLSEAVTRVVVPVGVAYGSDIARVFDTLQRAGVECPSALAEPSPSVMFKGFGDSSVDFDLRVYIATRSVYVETLNDILRRIDEGFRRDGIEIPFPQRDLHLRSSDVELANSSARGP